MRVRVMQVRDFVVLFRATMEERKADGKNSNRFILSTYEGFEQAKADSQIDGIWWDIAGGPYPYDTTGTRIKVEKIELYVYYR